MSLRIAGFKRRFMAGAVALAVASGMTALGAVAAPNVAHAAACSTATGVTAIVDYADLGGVDEQCGSGANARAVFNSAGVTMTGGPGGPDTVCRVNGKPDAGEECWGRTSDHWYIFVSRQGGPWTAATAGIDAVRVKPGDSVALMWQGTNKITPPSVKAPAFAGPVQSSKPAPTPGAETPAKEKPKAAPDTEAKEPRSAKSATAAATPSQDPTASVATTNSAADATETAATPTAAATESTPAEDQTAMAEPQVTPSDEVSPEIAAEDQAAAGDVQDSDDGGMPIWALIGAVVLLIGVSAFAVLRRKRVS